MILGAGIGLAVFGIKGLFNHRHKREHTLDPYKEIRKLAKLPRLI